MTVMLWPCIDGRGRTDGRTDGRVSGRRTDRRVSGRRRDGRTDRCPATPPPGACLFRMLQWAVVAGSPSYGTEEAVCTVLRVCWLEMGPRVRVEIPKSGIVSVSPCRLHVGSTVES